MTSLTSSAPLPPHIQSLMDAVATALGSLNEEGLLSTHEGVLAYKALDDHWRAVIFKTGRKIAGVSPRADQSDP